MRGCWGITICGVITVTDIRDAIFINSTCCGRPNLRQVISNIYNQERVCGISISIKRLETKFQLQNVFHICFQMIQIAMERKSKFTGFRESVQQNLKNQFAIRQLGNKQLAARTNLIGSIRNKVLYFISQRLPVSSQADWGPSSVNRHAGIKLERQRALAHTVQTKVDIQIACEG
ncbi:hypothetical protein PsAD46_04349 [Pseudovibrio sp. Ad46]|nr:hypothetical protein PsAD46_04349 [Pseudovibrio sp. Ad46]